MVKLLKRRGPFRQRQPPKPVKITDSMKQEDLFAMNGNMHHSNQTQQFKRNYNNNKGKHF